MRWPRTRRTVRARGNPGDNIKNGTSSKWTLLTMLPESGSLPRNLNEYLPSTRLQGGCVSILIGCWQAFDDAMAAYEAHCARAGRRVPLLLDSCCGTGPLPCIDSHVWLILS